MSERIYDVHMSEEMAYAESPYRAIARQAHELGWREGEGAALIKADRASQEAGYSYIKGLSGVLISHEVDGKAVNVTEVNLYDDDILELTTGRYVGLDDFRNFSMILSPNRDRRTNMVAAGSAWGALTRLYNYKKHRQEGRNLTGDPLIPDIPLEYIQQPTNNVRPDGQGLYLSSLVELIRIYDSYRSEHPGMRISKILGRVASTSRISFIKQFIDYEITQLRAEASSSDSM